MSSASSPRYLGPAAVEAALPITEAIAAARETFIALARGEVELPQRSAVQLGPAEAGAVSLIMGAASPQVGAVTKLVSVVPANAGRGLDRTLGVVTLVDPATGQLRGVLDGASLTALRTGAVSGLATELLAARDARQAAIIGAGRQAETQLLAIDAVRELERVRIYARTPAGVAAFIDRMQPRVRARLESSSSPEAAVTGASIVCAATGASTPVFPGRALEGSVHINAVGSFRPDMRELDLDSLRGAVIVVDHREAALEEAGELLAARDAGLTRVEDWLELGALALDPPATRPGERTVFDSVGLAVQDLFAAAWALERAAERGLGVPLEGARDR